MKRLSLLGVLALAGCLPADVTVTEKPATAAAAAPAPKPLPPEIANPVSTGLPVTSTLDCSVGGIGLFGNCEQEAAAVCTRAGLTMSSVVAIDPENPGVSGLATGFESIVESAPKPVTHRVTCV